MLKYVKAFTRDELDLALVNFNTLVIIISYTYKFTIFNYNSF